MPPNRSDQRKAKKSARKGPFFLIYLSADSAELLFFLLRLFDAMKLALIYLSVLTVTLLPNDEHSAAFS
jgi:hypothetical protein